MFIDDILKLDGSIASMDIIEQILDGEYCLWFDVEDDVYTIDLSVEVADFGQQRIRITRCN